MNEIDGNQIATTRDLQFYTDAYVAWTAVDCLLLNPVNPTAFLLLPPSTFDEASIELFPESCGAILLFAIENQKFKVC